MKSNFLNIAKYLQSIYDDSKYKTFEDFIKAHDIKSISIMCEENIKNIKEDKIMSPRVTVIYNNGNIKNYDGLSSIYTFFDSIQNKKISNPINIHIEQISEWNYSTPSEFKLKIKLSPEFMREPSIIISDNEKINLIADELKSKFIDLYKKHK